MVRTTIPVMTPLQHNDLYVGRAMSTHAVSVDGVQVTQHARPVPLVLTDT